MRACLQSAFHLFYVAKVGTHIEDLIYLAVVYYNEVCTITCCESITLTCLRMPGCMYGARRLTGCGPASGAADRVHRGLLFLGPRHHQHK